MKRIDHLRLPMLLLTLAVAVLAPPIPLTETFTLRPEFILAGLLFLWLLPEGGLSVLKHPVFIGMGALALVIAISMGHSALTLGRSLSLKDAFELAKVGVYAAIFYAACARAITASEFSRSVVWIQGIFILSAVVGIFQYFNLLNINEYLSPLYTHPSIGRELEGYRVVGTTSNANYYGMLMLLGICLALAVFLWSEKARERWISILGMALCTTSMLLSSSRTALAAASIAILFIAIRFIVWSRKDKPKLRRAGVIAGFLVIALVLVLTVLPSGWLARMDDLLAIFESQSMQEKLVHWQEHWNLYLQSPLFGHGPAKGLVSLYVDNEWLLFLVRYGIAGPIVVFMLGLSMFRAMSGLTSSPDTMGYGVAMQATLPAAAIFMITASVYHHQQLMAVVLLLIGFGLGVARGLTSMQAEGTQA